MVIHIYLVGFYVLSGRKKKDCKQYWTLPDIIERMAQCYCGTLAVEIEQLATQEQVDWLTSRVECRTKFPPDCMRGILKTLMRAEMFEHFLGEKFPVYKRYISWTPSHVAALVHSCISFAYSTSIPYMCDLLLSFAVYSSK